MAPPSREDDLVENPCAALRKRLSTIPFAAGTVKREPLLGGEGGRVLGSERTVTPGNGGAADHELRIEDHSPPRSIAGDDLVDQQTGGCRAKLVDGDSDRGQSGDEPTRQRNVVVADDGEVFRDAQAEAARQAARADRGHIGHREDRGGTVWK